MRQKLSYAEKFLRKAVNRTRKDCFRNDIRRAVRTLLVVKLVERQ